MSFFDLVKDKIVIDDETGCWNWIKSKREGYGQIMVKSFPWTAHRLAYSMEIGEIPDGKLVRHKCNNRACCNPEHLILGTDLDNWHDSEKEHQKSHLKLSKGWSVNGFHYNSMREVRSETGLCFATILKYTESGTFNVAAYRDGCRKANVKPKI